MIIPIIILAIAPQDHILGTDEINVQVSKLKLYLNILYKQEGSKSFRIFKGHLSNRKQKLCIYEKTKTKIISMFEE